MRLALALIAALMLAAPSHAQWFGNKQAPASKAEITLSFAPVAKKAAPSVVNVYGARVSEARNPFMDDPFFRRFFGEGAMQPRKEMQRSAGSGVLASSDGLVITNHHVIENMTEVKVQLNDRREYEAQVVLRDQRSDIAILRMKNAPSDLVPLEIGDSESLEVGDLVLAIGDPFGVGQTVTQGIVSALARTNIGVADYQSFIQTDAAINPGNSGGALIDMAGRLVGINTAIFSKSGGSHGIGFAIPVATVKLVLQAAKEGNGIVRRPYLGAAMEPVTPEMAESLRLPRPAGAIVQSVNKGSPAERAGLKTGDVIVTVDDLPVDDPDAFGYRFSLKPMGTSTTLGLIRSAKPVKLNVAIERAPGGQNDQLVLSGPTPFQGATVVSLSPALVEELRVGSRSEGVVIRAIAPDSAAARVGLQIGDIVLAVNGERIVNPDQLRQATSERARLWRIQIDRGGQVFTSVLGG